MGERSMKNISILGSGVVGSATGKGLKDIGNNVLFYDIDTNRIESLKKQDLHATTDLGYAVKGSEVFFLCVPTPDRNRMIDLSIIESAVKELSKECAGKKDYFLIVIKSTIQAVPKPQTIKIFNKFCFSTNTL